MLLQVLKKALDNQDFIIKDFKNADIPKINKQSRSFKDIAEALVIQMEFLRSKMGNHQKSLSGDEGEMTTIFTQHGDEIDQLNEIVIQKDQIIDMLTKEKNYYMKKVEQLQKQFLIQEEVQQALEEHEQKFEQAKSTVQTQKDLIKKQQDYITEMEDKQKQQAKEVDDLLNQINKLESQTHDMRRQELSSMKTNFNSASNNAIPVPMSQDEKRQWTTQSKLVEDLLKENNRLKENGLSSLDKSPFKGYDSLTSTRLEKLINELYLIVMKQPYSTVSLEDQLYQIKNHVEKSKESLLFSTKDLKQVALTEQRFSQIVNLNHVESLYQDFFSAVSNHEQVELKNRCFKDLYNIIEECVAKFHDLFVQYHSQRQKISKYEETFTQLDKVFSQEGNDEDGRVLEDLRKLGNIYLSQIFELQGEISLLKSLDDMPIEVSKLIKKSYTQKMQKAANNIGQTLSIEEQMIGMSERLKEQEIKLRQREKKLNKSRSKLNTSGTQRQFKSVERSSIQYGNFNNSQQELIMNLNKALDKIYELENINDGLDKEKILHLLEQKKQKEEIDKQLTEKKQLEQRGNEFEKKYKKLEDEIQNLKGELDDLQAKNVQLEKEVTSYSDKAKKVAELNEELRGLVEQERQAQNEEQKKIEDELEQVRKQQETKIKLLRSKLLMIIAGEGLDKDSTQMTIDEIIKKVQDLVFQLKKNQGSTGVALSQSYYQTSNQYKERENIQNENASLIQSKLVASSLGRGYKREDSPSQRQPQIVVTAVSSATSSLQQLGIGASGGYSAQITQNGHEESLDASLLFRPEQQKPFQEIQTNPNNATPNKQPNQGYYQTMETNEAGKFTSGNSKPSYISIRNQNSDTKLLGGGYPRIGTQYQNAVIAERQSHQPNMQPPQIPYTAYSSVTNNNNANYHKEPSSQYQNQLYSATQNYQQVPMKERNYSQQNYFASSKGNNPLLQQHQTFDYDNINLNSTQTAYDNFPTYHQQSHNNALSGMHEQSLRSDHNHSTSTERKKSINDILNNFKKEKEQFSEKLFQLREKLQSANNNNDIRSPEIHNHHQRIEGQPEYRREDGSFKYSQHENTATSTFMSPLIDNRRAKTLQKLKTHFGQHGKNEEDIVSERISMRPFELRNNCK